MLVPAVDDKASDTLVVVSGEGFWTGSSTLPHLHQLRPTSFVEHRRLDDWLLRSTPKRHERCRAGKAEQDVSEHRDRDPDGDRENAHERRVDRPADHAAAREEGTDRRRSLRVALTADREDHREDRSRGCADDSEEADRYGQPRNGDRRRERDR